ncbi:MAG: 5-(carboxyamino)imidazole ribonucleotide synthase [Thermostichus sp. DG02_5_bins_236]
MEQQTKQPTAQPVGVIGGGQLAQMMGWAARRLGIPWVVQAASPADPAVAVAEEIIWGAVTDVAATARLLERCSVVTFENEFIPLAQLLPLDPEGCRFRPSLDTLKPLLDKGEQREFLSHLGLPVPGFQLLPDSAGRADLANLDPLVDRLNRFPVVLKQRRHGYDGQGTQILHHSQALQQALQKQSGIPLLLEEWIPFERELAVVIARSMVGEIQVYPVAETLQVEQICRRVIVPARIPQSVASKVQEMAAHLMEKLQAVGVFGLELFWVPEEHPKAGIWINELSPRVHNSGHYTLDACLTSQFEQHLRAITGQPLGDPALKCGGAVMVNLLGYEHSQSDYAEKRTALARIPNATVHWYNKTPARPGRKLGHVTVCLPTAADLSQAEALSERIESLWYEQP